MGMPHHAAYTCFTQHTCVHKYKYTWTHRHSAPRPASQPLCPYGQGSTMCQSQGTLWGGSRKTGRRELRPGPHMPPPGTLCFGYSHRFPALASSGPCVSWALHRGQRGRLLQDRSPWPHQGSFIRTIPGCPAWVKGGSEWPRPAPQSVNTGLAESSSRRDKAPRSARCSAWHHTPSRPVAPHSLRDPEHPTTTTSHPIFWLQFPYPLAGSHWPGPARPDPVSGPHSAFLVAVVTFCCQRRALKTAGTAKNPACATTPQTSLYFYCSVNYCLNFNKSLRQEGDLPRASLCKHGPGRLGCNITLYAMWECLDCNRNL